MRRIRRYYTHDDISSLALLASVANNDISSSGTKRVKPGLGEVKYEVIPEYAEFLRLNEIKGVLVNGTTGEGVSLTTRERMDVLQAWVQNWKETVMVQIGGTNMKDIKSLAKHAESLNVGAILCLPDLFFRPSNIDDLIEYLKIVSAAAPKTPLLYYHIPSFTGIKLNMEELLERSSEVATFVGIKYTDNDLMMGSSCVKKGKAVFLGSDTLLLPALFQGFDSAIGTTINMFPSPNKDILEYFQAKKYEEAVKRQEFLNECINEIVKCGSWVSSMKAVMREITPIAVGPVRDPLVDVTFNKRIIGLKRKIGLI